MAGEPGKNGKARRDQLLEGEPMEDDLPQPAERDTGQRYHAQGDLKEALCIGRLTGS